MINRGMDGTGTGYMKRSRLDELKLARIPISYRKLPGKESDMGRITVPFLLTDKAISARSPAHNILTGPALVAIS